MTFTESFDSLNILSTCRACETYAYCSTRPHPSTGMCVYFQTLVMDMGRFLDLHDKTRELTLIASVLLVTFSTVGAPIAGIQELKTTLKSNILTVIGAEK